MDVFRARGVRCVHNTQIPSEVFVCVETPQVNSPNLDVSMSKIFIYLVSSYK